MSKNKTTKVPDDVAFLPLLAGLAILNFICRTCDQALSYRACTARCDGLLRVTLGYVRENKSTEVLTRLKRHGHGANSFVPFLVLCTSRTTYVTYVRADPSQLGLCNGYIPMYCTRYGSQRILGGHPVRSGREQDESL